MYYIAFNNKTKDILEVASISIDFSITTNVNNFKSSIAINKNLTIDDVGLYIITDNAVATRVKQHHEYDITWADNGEEYLIDSLDFSIEDNKRLVIFETVDPDDNVTRKSDIIGDGIDTARIFVRIYLPDLSGIDTTFNGSIKVPILDPSKVSVFVKVDIVNGVGIKDFKTTKYGKWIIPNNYNFEGQNAKIFDGFVYDVDVIMDI